MLVEKDEKDKRMDYQALLKMAKPDIAHEIAPERIQERWDAAQRSLGRLREVLEATRPDVIVVVGDDQGEQFSPANMPTFCIYRGETMEIVKKQSSGGQWGNMAWRSYATDGVPDDPRPYEAAPSLANHLIRSLNNADFDVSACAELKPEVGMGHAYSFLYRTILPEGNVPVLPIMVNTMYAPNTPTAKRCYDLGRGIRKAIEAWDTNKTVAIMASGGLSHVILDEELDRIVVDALAEKDAETLRALPAERLDRAAGTTEIRNWVVLAGAMEPLNMTLASYEPCYRSPAATGLGMAFAYWS
jgi:3-O-methylgallate 3,4-dioxygenase